MFTPESHYTIYFVSDIIDELNIKYNMDYTYNNGDDNKNIQCN